jgi:hypothetical protein
MCISIILISIILFLASPADGLSDSTYIDLYDQAEDNEKMLEHIDDLNQNPVHINTACKTEWQRIPFLNDIQIESILKIRNEKGKFESVDALKSIIGNARYELIRSLLTCRQSRPWSLIIRQSNRLASPAPEAVKSNRYKGDALVNTTRIRFNYGEHFNGGLICAKDAGEPDYLDRLTGYISYSQEGFNVILGNISVQHGGGLIFANPYANMKSSYATLSFRQKYTRIKPSVSRSSLRTHSGVTLHYTPLPYLELITVCTLNRRDAYVLDDGKTITGIREGGYHRTETELNARNKIRETQQALFFQFHYKNDIKLGIALSHIGYIPGIKHSISTVGSAQKRRTCFSFSGRKLTQGSLTYAVRYGSVLFSGESAVNGRSGAASSNTLFIRSKSVRAGIRHWYLTPSYQSPYGSAFDDASSYPQGKTGFYLAIRWRFARGMYLNAYKLLKKNLWRSYFDPLPTHSANKLISIDIKRKGNRFQLRFTESCRESYQILASGVETVIPDRKSQIRMDLRTKLSAKLRLRARWHHIRRRGSGETGTNIFQNIRLEVFRNLHCDIRLSFFKSNSYDTRLYEYESDIPYAFSNLALYGDGKKYCILLKYMAHQRFKLWYKWRYLDYRANGKALIKREFRIMIQLDLDNQQ